MLYARHESQGGHSYSRNEPTTKIWAHRGFSANFPENTLAAFEAALHIGADGLEFDIHKTRDGHLVVHHDAHLGRTTNGHGLIRDLTLEELKHLDAGSWFGPEFSGLQIPTFAEVLDLVALFPSRPSLNIESKSGPILYPNMEAEAWDMVVDRGLANRCIVSSFNHFALRDLKIQKPDANIGLLYQAGLVEPWNYATTLGASAIHPYFISFDETVVAGCHKHKITVNTYTVNDEESARRLMHWGVDAIITDSPDLLLSLR